jgi:threonine dehydrogenase-like Zn-dependent dehydrogenase
MDAFPHRLVAHRARILMLAVHTETVFNWGMLHIPEASIEVSCHFSLDDLRVLLQLLERGELHIGPLITHRAPIGDAIAVYEELRDDPRDMLGIVFDW